MIGAISIVGGLGLILFGISLFRHGLDALFGEKLYRWISRTTATPARGFATGVVAGVVTPSSTGLSILIAQMLAAAHLTSSRGLALFLGAGVGMTLIVQLLAFRLSDYAGLFIALGAAGYLFAKKPLFRQGGQCLLGFGLIYLSLGMISSGAQVLSESPKTVALLHSLHGHPWAALGAVTIVTVLLQSSTAAISLGIGMAAAGLLDTAILVPWILGTNLGLAVTTLIAGWGHPEGRRMGSANLGLKIAGALILMALPGVAQHGFEFWSGSLLRQTVMSHTAYNVILGLLALPFVEPIDRWAGMLTVSRSPGPILSETPLSPKAPE